MDWTVMKYVGAVLALCLLGDVGLAQTELPENTARVHYGRPDGVYEGFTLHVWEDTTEEVTWASGLEPSGSDDYGVYWDVGLTEDAGRLGFIVHKGDEKDPGPDMFLTLGTMGNEVWVVSGDETVYTSLPLGPPEEGTARVHYYRPDGDYEGFTLHVWEDADETVTWEEGLEISGTDSYGAYWDVNLVNAAERLGFIVHRGDEKDPGPDMFLDLSSMGNEVWIISGSDTLYTEQPDIRTTASGDLGKAQAHFVTPGLIAWQVGTVTPGTTFALHASPTAGLELGESDVTGGEAFPLTLFEEGLPEAVLEKFPHLAGYDALALPEDAVGRVPKLLQGQLAVSMTNAGQVLDATGLQIPGVLDALYADAAQGEALGPGWTGDVPSLALWAPTAQGVKVHLFADADGEEAQAVLELRRDDESGVWSVEGEPGWDKLYYLFEVQVYAPSSGQIETNLVTDPYSLSLSMNSAKSQLVNLEADALKPDGWDSLQKPPLERFEDISLYELHLRDFSAGDLTVPENLRGTYRAFAVKGDGTRHLAALAEAGLTHVHLLPTFDIATINEDKSAWQEPDADLASLPADSPKQQEAIMAIRDEDPFNWGYDPHHYNVPEGSYATDPEGPARILEYREMVQGLSEVGLRVVNDVVYNHTNSSGQADKSVLDKIVPGYYHRLNADGAVETSTCCQNTASEHAMMRKLMVDSVLLWATAYKVDGFRFDLMGHHMVEDMLAVRAALDALTLEDDGVDGSKVYLYGEGWNFGEVAGGARGLNATQLNLGGTGIGTFNDRLRDAVRGGGPFDGGESLVTNQGFINGLYYLPNEAVRAGEEEQLARLLLSADQIRVGLAGNLAEYSFEARDGAQTTGAEVDYNGSPTGYTQAPAEHIVYVSAHDNQTLWDISQYKIPEGVSTEDRVRMHNVGLDIVALSQGVPFFHAGSELLRSKSFDRNSYNSGDWFNRLDFSYATNGYAGGLPPEGENRENWRYMRPRLVNPALSPGMEHIESALEHFQTMLSVRYSSPLFRLETAEDVMSRLAFHNTGPEQVPGVIVMSLSDTGEDLSDLDPEHDLIVVMVNATDERHTVNVPALEGFELRLHPSLKNSGDPVVKTSAHYAFNNTLSVPAFTTAVFVAVQ